MEEQKPPRTIKQLLAAILEVLLCMDASIHRIEKQLGEGPGETISALDTQGMR